VRPGTSAGDGVIRMSMETWETIFAPTMRYWREYQDHQKSRVVVVPALDKGPRPGPVQIDWDARIVTLDPAAAPAADDAGPSAHATDQATPPRRRTPATRPPTQRAPAPPAPTTPSRAA